MICSSRDITGVIIYMVCCSGKYACLSSECKSLELKEREIQYSLCRTMMSAFAPPVHDCISFLSSPVYIGLYLYDGPTYGYKGLLCSAGLESSLWQCSLIRSYLFRSGRYPSSLCVSSGLFDITTHSCSTFAWLEYTGHRVGQEQIIIGNIFFLENLGKFDIFCCSAWLAHHKEVSSR